VAARVAAVAVREEAGPETRVANQKEVWHLQVKEPARELRERAVKHLMEVAARVVAQEEAVNNTSREANKKRSENTERFFVHGSKKKARSDRASLI
jgi:hypothetical protein